MKFKLDENFGLRTQMVFRDAGHDVSTVREQNFQGCSDRELYRVCKEESRCLVTLDLDFSDTIQFPPKQTSGIAVIRVPKNPSLSLLERLIQQFTGHLESETIHESLWIVEIGRIRIHQAE